jgi:hypothetical protein
MLGAQGDVVGIFHLAKRALDVMLGAVATHDLGIGPVIVVGEQDGLAEQGLLQALPGAVIEAVAQCRQPLAFADVHREQLLHVACLEPTVNLLGDALHGGRLTPTDLPGLASA